METGAQLHHLPRYEKKRLVKGWHATQPLSDPSPAPWDPNDGSIGVTSAGSMRSLFATPPGALEYEGQRTATRRTTPDLFSANCSQQTEEKLPKTVGQVKHAYRARARKLEARDASKAIRQREEFLEVRRGPKWREELSKTKKKPQQPELVECPQESMEDEEKEGTMEVAASPQDEFGGELQLMNLPVDDVVVSAAYRDDILRRIRHHLVNGGEVLLQSDCASSKETVSSTRLMLQTLCTQSLAYCVRDQNVVPDVLLQPQSTTRLTLRLLPRHRNM